MVILYLDHNSHPSPLSLTYHATASRLLSSSLPHINPPSIFHEVEAAYCPQCLSFHDAFTSISSNLKGCCSNHLCKACPVCKCNLTVSVEEDEEGEDGMGTMVCLYKCGYCKWTSRECDLVSRNEDVMLGVEDLGRQWQKRVDCEHDSSSSNNKEESKELFDRLLHGWGQKAQEHERHKRIVYNSSRDDVSKRSTAILSGAALRLKTSSSGDHPYHPSSKPSQGEEEEEIWSIDALEKSMRVIKLHALENATRSVVSYQPTVQSTAATTQSPPQDLNYYVNQYPPMVTDQAISQTLHSSSSSSNTNSASLLPLRIPLRAKTSKRCKAQLQQNKPGILVKPKMNPLEGDSSLRSGHGQWWKKESSAIHLVPKLSLLNHGTTQVSTTSTTPNNTPNVNITALLMSVHNPTLGPIHLRVIPPPNDLILKSSNSSSMIHMNHDNGGGGGMVRNMILNPYQQTYESARIITPVAGGVSVPSEIMELDAVQDAFFDTTKTARHDDDAHNLVHQWNANHAIRSFLGYGTPEPNHDNNDGDEEVEEHDKNGEMAWDSNFSPSYKLKAIATKEDTAWFELLVVSPTPIDGKKEEDGVEPYLAVPMSMQIDVGNGSWESSLIPPKPKNPSTAADGDDGDVVADGEEEVDRDFVNFDVLVVWQDKTRENEVYCV